MIFARKMPEIYVKTVRKIFFPNFFGRGGARFPCPPSIRLLTGRVYKKEKPPLRRGLVVLGDVAPPAAVNDTDSRHVLPL